MNKSSRNRLVLAALLLLFALPLALAFLLRAGGWHPRSTRNSGTLVDPPRDVAATSITLADGSRYVWHDPRYRWTLLMLPGTECARVCRTRVEEALRMRITLGRNAERLRVLYLGPALPPEFATANAPLDTGRDDNGAFTGERAIDDDDLALALVDPNGKLVLRYPAGYSAQGLRNDIMQIIY
jgi:hypothetical protein